jgi:two-component sensor histidine kinase
MSVVRTVADQFAEMLANAGVERIYGIVGDSLNGLADAIRRQDKIEWIYVRQEQVAAFAAGAEAHLTGLLAMQPKASGLLRPTPVVTASQKDLDHPPVSKERGLLRERCHRIRREFASTINLVSGAAVRKESPDVKTALNDFVDLRHAHVVLAMPDRDKLVDAAEYLCNFGWSINSSRLHRMKINLTISAETSLETERCRLLAEVVKELVKNAVRHACFFGTREGKISIELTWEGSFVHCAVSDNVQRMARARPVRGLRIAHNLARSLGGRIGHWFDDEGTSFVVTFPFTERELQEIRTPGPRYASA